jgi:2-C-methyl-D-erythritol 4-phosphate cytidylyltransferase
LDSKRIHYVKNVEKKDWKNFFAEMGNDDLIEATKEKLQDYRACGKTVILVSARPDLYRDITSEWLVKNGLDFVYTILMRHEGDTRPDTEVKQDILDVYFPNKECIHVVIDDRPSVIRMWKNNGLEVIDVGSGEEF